MRVDWLSQVWCVSSWFRIKNTHTRAPWGLRRACRRFRRSADGRRMLACSRALHPRREPGGADEEDDPLSQPSWLCGPQTSQTGRFRPAGLFVCLPPTRRQSANQSPTQRQKFKVDAPRWRSSIASKLTSHSQERAIHGVPPPNLEHLRTNRLLAMSRRRRPMANTSQKRSETPKGLDCMRSLAGGSPAR